MKTTVLPACLLFQTRTTTFSQNKNCSLRCLTWCLSSCCTANICMECMIFYKLCNYFFLGLFFSSFSTSHCGSWTCWSGSSPVWFCTSYTLCCALNAGTTLCRWALFSAATTMSFLNCFETASSSAKPTPTLCPPTVWGSSHSKGFSARPRLQPLDMEGKWVEVF